MLWLYSIVLGTFWYLLSSRSSWFFLNENIATTAGLVVGNLMVFLFALPVPIVLVLLMLTAFKARRLLARIADSCENTQPSQPSALASQQIESDLRLLRAFGIVYIVGFGFMFVISINQLINLSGAVNVLPYWQKDKTFCVYMIAIEQVCNMTINFSNCVLIVQSRHVRVALRRMFRATSGFVRTVIRGGEDRQGLVQVEEES